MEKGLSLSGGQRQRVSIARALMKPSPIIIFDDSLSAVDSKTETGILQILRSEMKSRTTIIISHRISTIQHADQIIVLDERKIVERGTHQELINKNGIYKKMLEQQTTQHSLELQPLRFIHRQKIFIKRRRRT